MTLSQQIEADLRAHARTETLPPYRLTLQAMAERFDVSIQPVRTAVDTLLEQGVLLRDSEGRLAFTRRRGGLDPFTCWRIVRTRCRISMRC